MDATTISFLKIVMAGLNNGNDGVSVVTRDKLTMVASIFLLVTT